MAQVDSDLYVAFNYDPSRSDGLYIERSSGNIVLIINGAVVKTFSASSESYPALAEGKVLIGNASGQAAACSVTGTVAISSSGVTSVPLAEGKVLIGNSGGSGAAQSISGAITLAANGATTIPLAEGKVLIGNSGGVTSAQTLSGDATLSASGVVTLADNQRTLVSTKTFSSDGTGADYAIVGTGAGSLNNGVTLVSGVEGKVIVPLCVTIDYTYSTAAYTDGQTLKLFLDGVELYTTISKTDTFGSASSKKSLILCGSDYSLLVTSGSALTMSCSAGYTNPGTAAGTATIKTYYKLVTI